MINKLPNCFYRLSVMALIFKKEKVLLVKEVDGRWSLPGGGLKVGESFLDGLSRELKEELSVKIIEMSPQPLYVWTFVENKNNDLIPKITLVFKVEIDSFNFKNDPKESVEINFFSKPEMQNLNLHLNTQELIKFL
ncbi:hypothetical protein SDC9_98380 [bioreactor metagenome]|uniref:Nudix hydrolase domain-containing protein n=1 Tax=bioreactor metagenome TaxID=1076179 RepID=A0A645AEP6_9ZZZZ